MFPGRWPYYPESMWNYGWSAPAPTPDQPAVPLGQFCGSDPSFQQSQAQTQAQISAFQQQNALLNQQLHNQSQTHINHLQQLLPHHQVQQTTPTPPSVQPPPANTWKWSIIPPVPSSGSGTNYGTSTAECAVEPTTPQSISDSHQSPPTTSSSSPSSTTTDNYSTFSANTTSNTGANCTWTTDSAGGHTKSTGSSCTI